MWYRRPRGVPRVGCRVPFQVPHARMDTAQATALRGGGGGGPGNSVIGKTQEEPEETRLRRNKVLDLEGVLPPEVG